MKTSIALSLVLFVLVPASALTDEVIVKKKVTETQETQAPGTTAREGADRPKPRLGLFSEDPAKNARKSSVGPHAIMVHTALQSARTELNGIRSQLRSVPSDSSPSPEIIEQLKLHGKNIGSDVKTALSHESELSTAARKFPNLTSEEKFTKQSAALRDVESLNQAWQSNAANSAYWRDREKVDSDLDMLSKRLNQAIGDVQSFGSDQLDLSFVG